MGSGSTLPSLIRWHFSPKDLRDASTIPTAAGAPGDCGRRGAVAQILISGRPVESKNQQVADLPHGDTYLHEGDTYLRRGNKYRKDATDHCHKRDGYFRYGHDHVPAAHHY